MTTPGHLIGWHRWADEACQHNADYLINGRIAEPWERDIQARSRAAALEAETKALFSGVGITPNHDR